RFLLIAIAWAFVFVWIPPGSRPRYFMPLMPLCAALMGIVGDSWMSVPWRNWSPVARRSLFLASCALLAVIQVGPLLTIEARMCEGIAGQITEVKAKLPVGARLVSLDQLHHGFLYFYNEPIPLVPLPETAQDLPANVEYFALHTHDADPPPLPFAWET